MPEYIALDFSKCRHPYDVHCELKRAFSLPEHYGRNWDALWDCLRYLWLRNGKTTVEIFGYTSMSEELREYCAEMLRVFFDVEVEFPNVHFELVS